MSGPSANGEGNGVVYHLISELIDVPEQQNDSVDDKEERQEPPPPAQATEQATTSNTDEFESTVEQKGKKDASTRLIEYRQRKRTTITPSQRAILEEFYMAGMTRSGMQFSALHQAAAQKTGLSVYSIQVPCMHYCCLQDIGCMIMVFSY